MPPESENKFSAIAAEITITVILLIVALGFLGAYIDRVLEWYESILDWLYSRDFKIIKIVFLVLNGLLFAFAIYSWRKFSQFRATPPAAPETFAHAVSPKEEVEESWRVIQELINSNSASDWNMAILRADALLSDVLLHKGYEGETIADRLKVVSPTVVPSIDRLWSAHRLRNQIAHEPLKQHPKEILTDALNAYQQTFIELGMMEKILVPIEVSEGPPAKLPTE